MKSNFRLDLNVLISVVIALWVQGLPISLKIVVFVCLQVLADVFNAPVYIKDVINSAALGSAYRAMLGMICSVHRAMFGIFRFSAKRQS